MGEGAEVTINSLAKGTFQDYKLIIVPDQNKGVQWARNEGFKQVDTEFVLFSDDDIEWKTHALETLLRVLQATPKASYSYGRYKLGNEVWCHQGWDPIALKRMNYISTMSLIRTADLPEKPWDESIKRLQDWDLWLTLLEQGKRGVYVEDLIFETPLKNGISHGGQNYLDSILIVRKKHNI
jgi:glycosyltransferase involved in cell wall biosynthesis